MRSFQVWCRLILPLCIATSLAVSAQAASRSKAIVRLDEGSRDAPSPPAVARLGDQLFVVTRTLRYSIGSTGVVIAVPVGLLTDLASIPRALWWFESPIDRSMAAAILHDYLYWDQRCSKDQADAILYLAMGESGATRRVRDGVYAGVRTPIGVAAYRNDGKARQAGEQRILSASYVDTVIEQPAIPNANLKSVQAAAKTAAGFLADDQSNPQIAIACKVAYDLFRTK